MIDYSQHPLCFLKDGSVVKIVEITITTVDFTNRSIAICNQFDRIAGLWLPNCRKISLEVVSYTYDDQHPWISMPEMP